MSKTVKYPAQVLERFASRAGHGYSLVRGFSQKLNIKFVAKDEPPPVVDDTPKDIETPSATTLPSLTTQGYVFSATSGMFATFFIGPYSFNSISFEKLAELMNTNTDMDEKGLVFEVKNNTLLIKATKEDITVDTFSWNYTQDLSVMEDENHAPITVSNKSYSSVTFVSTQENVVVNPVEEQPAVITEPAPEEPVIPTVIPPQPETKSLVTNELVFYLNHDETFNQFKLNDIHLYNTGLPLIQSELHRLYPNLNVEMLASGLGLRVYADENIVFEDVRIMPNEGRTAVVGEHKEGIQTQYPYPGVIYDTIVLEGSLVKEEEPAPTAPVDSVSDETEQPIAPDESNAIPDPEVVIPEQPIIEDTPEPIVNQYLEVRNMKTGGFQRFTLEQLLSGNLEMLHTVMNTSADTSVTYNPEQWVFEINRYDATELEDITIVSSIVTVTTHHDGAETTETIAGEPVTVNVFASDVGKTITTPVINTASKITINLLHATPKQEEPVVNPEPVVPPVENEPTEENTTDEPTTSESESSETTPATGTEESSENPTTVEETPTEDAPEATEMPATDAPSEETTTVPSEENNASEEPVEPTTTPAEETTETTEEQPVSNTESTETEQEPPAPVEPEKEKLVLELDRSISVKLANNAVETDRIGIAINGHASEGTMREIVDTFSIVANKAGLNIKAIMGANKVMDIHSADSNSIDVDSIEVYGIDSPVNVGINYEFADYEYTVDDKFVVINYRLGGYDAEPYSLTSTELVVEDGVNSIILDNPDINNATLVIDGLVVTNMIDDLKVGDNTIRDELEVYLNGAPTEDGKFVLTNSGTEPMYVVLSVLNTPDTVMPVFSENSTLTVSDRQFNYNDLSYKVFEFVLDGNALVEENMPEFTPVSELPEEQPNTEPETQPAYVNSEPVDTLASDE